MRTSSKFEHNWETLDVKLLECKKVLKKEMKKTKIERKQNTRTIERDVYCFMSKRETREASVWFIENYCDK